MVMVVCEELPGRVELNLDCVRKSLREALCNLQSQEKLLFAIQESVSESSKGLDAVSEALREWLKRVDENEDQALDLFQEEDVKGLKSEKEKWGLINGDVEVIQEKLNEEVKFIEGICEKMKLEMKEFQTTGKAISDRFREIDFRERQFNLIKVQLESRIAKLDKREEHLERCEKEIELREAVLASKREEIKAEADVLNARERIIGLVKELNSLRKSKRQSPSKLVSASPSASREQSENSRKRLRNSAMIPMEINDGDHDVPLTTNCHVERSSNSPEIGVNSVHSISGSASGDRLVSDEMDANQVNQQASNRGPVNDNEHVFELRKSHSVEINDGDHDGPLTTNCHVERSSDSPETGANSVHSNSGSASGDRLVSDEVDANHVNQQASNRGPVNDGEQVFELPKSHSVLWDDSVSDPIDYSGALINDFEMQRSKECFECGQIWACYDSEDPNCSMPRLYVRIESFLSKRECDFMLITTILWRTPYTDAHELQKYEGWEAWIEAGLPVGCGNFKRSCQSIKYLHDFSHQMCYKGIDSSFLIYPTKGQIWALYKDWSFSTWISSPERCRNCKYEIVEVLDNDNSSGSIRVGFLDKVAGFVSLFQKRSRDGNDSFVISGSEMLRFSHKVPSFKMTGSKRPGVPDGSFELDYVSLPANL